MNLNKCFNQDKFDSYQNIFAIRRKVNEIWAKGYNPTDFEIKKEVHFDMLKIYKLLKPGSQIQYLLLGITRKYYPIYGHFYNNANNFIYKKIYNNQIQDVKFPSKYNIIKYEELAKNINNNYYWANSIKEALYIANQLNLHEIPDIYIPNPLIDKDIVLQQLYEYDSEKITEYADPSQISFEYNNETGILHIK